MISLVAPVFRIFVITLDIFQFLWGSYWDIMYTCVYSVISKPEKPLTGKTVLVTGAAHGVGKQLACHFASNGCNIICWDLDQAANEASLAELRAEYPQVRSAAHTVDVSDAAAVQTAAEKVLSEFGGLDVLVNNAGIMPTKRFLQHSPREVRAVIDVNLMSQIWTLRAFLPSMYRAGAGSVVSICSNCGLLGSPSLVPYCASKHAIRGLMEALVEEERHFRSDRRPVLHHLTVFPFIIDTRLAKHPRVRFPWLMPLLSPEYVASETVRALKQGEEVLFFPKWMYPGYLFSRLWPRRMQQRFYDLINAGLDEQSFEAQDVSAER